MQNHLLLTLVCADYETKNAYAFAMQRYLDEGRIMFMQDGASGNPYKDELSNEFAKQSDEILTQMSRCRRFMPKSTLDNPGVRVSWSGKVDHNGTIIAGLKDDMAVCLTIATYWADKIMQLDYPTVNYRHLGLL